MALMMRHISTGLLAAVIAVSLPAQTVTWWDKSFDEALAAAKGKPAEMVLLYCWQDKHDTCAAMFDGTMGDEKVSKKLTDFVCMGVQDNEAGRAVWQRYCCKGTWQVPKRSIVRPCRFPGPHRRGLAQLGLAI